MVIIFIDIKNFKYKLRSGKVLDFFLYILIAINKRTKVLTKIYTLLQYNHAKYTTLFLGFAKLNKKLQSEINFGISKIVLKTLHAINSVKKHNLEVLILKISKITSNNFVANLT